MEENICVYINPSNLSSGYEKTVDFVRFKLDKTDVDDAPAPVRYSK